MSGMAQAGMIACFIVGLLIFAVYALMPVVFPSAFLIGFILIVIGIVIGIAPRVAKDLSDKQS